MDDGSHAAHDGDEDDVSDDELEVDRQVLEARQDNNQRRLGEAIAAAVGDRAKLAELAEHLPELVRTPLFLLPPAARPCIYESARPRKEPATAAADIRCVRLAAAARPEARPIAGLARRTRLTGC